MRRPAFSFECRKNDKNDKREWANDLEVWQNDPGKELWCKELNERKKNNGAKGEKKRKEKTRKRKEKKEKNESSKPVPLSTGLDDRKGLLRMMVLFPQFVMWERVTKKMITGSTFFWQTDEGNNKPINGI